MPGKEGNFCVPSIVSRTICPHLPEHLVSRYAISCICVTMVSMINLREPSRSRSRFDVTSVKLSREPKWRHYDLFDVF